MSPEKPTDCMNHEGMSAISVFLPKFTVEFTGEAINFLLNRKSFKREQAYPQQANGKGKKPFQS